MSKQQKKKIDKYEALIEEGYSISYPSVVNAMNEIEMKKREAYIRQQYDLGDIVEFDFGVVRLNMANSSIRELQLAVFTAAYSNYRWLNCTQNRIQDAFWKLTLHSLINLKGIIELLCMIILKLR